MGSGGPRGLQILRSGVSVRGGFDSHTFPPTLLCCALALLGIVTGGPARAGDAVPDTAIVTPARADSTAADSTRPGVYGTASDEAAILTLPPGERRVVPPLGRYDQPHWVMLRSLAIPGWGQWHNGSWIKTALIGGPDAYLRVRVLHDQHELKGLSQTADVTGASLASANQAVAAAEKELAEAQASGDSARIAAAEQALLAANLSRAGASSAYNTAVLAYNTVLNEAINRRWLLATVLLYSLIDAYIDAHFRNFDTSLQYYPAPPGAKGGPGMRFQVRWSF